MSTTRGAFTAGSAGHIVISLWDVLRASHGQEHRNLVMSQTKIVEPTNRSPSYISYTENVSKNHSGELYSTEEGEAQTDDSSPKLG